MEKGRNSVKISFSKICSNYDICSEKMANKCIRMWLFGGTCPIKLQLSAELVLSNYRFFCPRRGGAKGSPSLFNKQTLQLVSGTSSNVNVMLMLLKSKLLKIFKSPTKISRFFDFGGTGDGVDIGLPCIKLGK